jgi:hypothetical protein
MTEEPSVASLLQSTSSSWLWSSASRVFGAVAVRNASANRLPREKPHDQAKKTRTKGERNTLVVYGVLRPVSTQ